MKRLECSLRPNSIRNQLEISRFKVGRQRTVVRTNLNAHGSI